MQKTNDDGELWLQIPFSDGDAWIAGWLVTIEGDLDSVPVWSASLASADSSSPRPPERPIAPTPDASPMQGGEGYGEEGESAASDDGAGEDAAENVSSPELAANVFTRENLPEEYLTILENAPAEVKLLVDGSIQTFSLTTVNEFVVRSDELFITVNGREVILTRENGAMIRQFGTDWIGLYLSEYFSNDEDRERAGLNSRIFQYTYPVAARDGAEIDIESYDQDDKVGFGSEWLESAGLQEGNLPFSETPGSQAFEAAYIETLRMIYNVQHPGSELPYEDFFAGLQAGTLVDFSVRVGDEVVTDFRGARFELRALANAAPNPFRNDVEVEEGRLVMIMDGPELINLHLNYYTNKPLYLLAEANGVVMNYADFVNYLIQISLPQNSSGEFRIPFGMLLNDNQAVISSSK